MNEDKEKIKIRKRIKAIARSRKASPPRVLKVRSANDLIRLARYNYRQIIKRKFVL